MWALLKHYLSLWNNLEGKEFSVREAASTLKTSEESTRVTLARLREEHMLYSPRRGSYRLVKPEFWTALMKLQALSPFDKSVTDSLLEELAIKSDRIHAIILHGSRISGESDSLSDLDGILIAEENISKQEFPIDFEVQKPGSYDNVHVNNAIKYGRIIYGDDTPWRPRKPKKKDYLRVLDDIQGNLFRLEDEKLFDSLTLRDVSHILYSNLRRLEVVEKLLYGKNKQLKIDKRILTGTRELYRLSKSNQKGVPKVTRTDLRKLSKVLIEKWVELRASLEK